ncbi:nucleotide exchange factor GrpE [Candidatus Dependentiae bacterium]|jgi:molecular chaperone GrpE|nr:nucleotide exchange factor GrpE [Candidatus Dependentiae bacterium]
MNIHDETDNKSTTHGQPESQTDAPFTNENSIEETANDYRAQFLRASADFANYKRRVEKERLEWMQTAQSSILQKVLPIIDDLERALAHTQNNVSTEQNPWVEGFILIQKNAQKLLADLGVELIDASGTFDPELHEALVSVQVDNKQEGQIVDVLRKGYLFKGKVLRHTQVTVAK